jgi:hypothetical protein
MAVLEFKENRQEELRPVLFGRTTMAPAEGMSV